MCMYIYVWCMHVCVYLYVSEGEVKDVRQRRRDLLQQYYGLGEGEEGVGRPQPAAAVAVVRPIDIDSMHFNVDSYMDKMLQEKSFIELLNAQKTFDEGTYICASFAE